MNEEQMKNHALEFAGVYAFLLQDTAKMKHDPDAHNLCSAVVECDGMPLLTAYSYSNPSALKAQRFQSYEFVIGSQNDINIINRGGFQDLHTEVRLLNYVFSSNYSAKPSTISFFSSRSVCNTCRKAIYQFMADPKIKNNVAVMAFEFKVEQHGSVTEFVYPILEDPNAEQARFAIF